VLEISEKLVTTNTDSPASQLTHADYFVLNNLVYSIRPGIRWPLAWLRWCSPLGFMTLDVNFLGYVGFCKVFSAVITGIAVIYLIFTLDW